jgi:thiol-disulfide isomerase/thioredoxin
MVVTMKRRRRTKTGASYGVLEPRQLLATTGLAQFDGDSSIDTGLIVNGNFDQNEIADATSQRVDIDDVAGWSQTSGASDVISLVGFDDSPRGTGFHLDDQADVLESIFQEVNTEIGQQYTLAFDLMGRSVADTADAASNDVRVLWDNAEVGTFRGISDFWQTFTVDVIGGAADLTRLEIQEVDGAGNDGIGALLDNMRLVPVSSQTVENGSFENNESGTIGEDDVPGWSSIGEDNERFLDVQTGDSGNGTRFLNLDRQAGSSDIIFTNIDTESGGVYFVSFDLRSESGVVGEDEEMRIRWNDEWVGTYRGNADWQSFGFTVRADSDSTRLVFREPGDTFTGDGDGPLLDNVRITKVVPSIGLSLNDTATFEFTENGSAVDLGDRVEAITSTVDDAITGVTISLPNAVANESVTAVVTTNGITATERSENGTLSITGSRTTQEYLNILQTLQYENTSDNPTSGSRAITIQVNAGDSSSSSSTLTVNVTPVNDAPVVAGIADSTALVEEEFSVLATATDPEDDGLTWTVTATGDAILSTDAQPTVDDDGNVSWTPARAGDAVLTVRATDSGGLFDEQTFEVSVTGESVTLDTGTILVNSGTDLPAFDSTALVDPAIGQTIANFEAQTIDGGTFNSFEQGTPRIYSMLAHWCSFCNAELPEIVSWMAETDLGDVEFVAGAVAVRSTEANYPPSDWLNDAGFNGTVIVDNEAAKLMSIMGTSSFPFLVAVDASGTVVERFSGQSTRAQLDAALAAVQG